MLFDTHAHCDDERIKNEFGSLDDYIRHQLENGVGAIVNIGTNLENSRVSIELSKKFEQIYATCGIHPYDIRFYDDMDDALLALEELILSSKKVVALGEIGLDYHYEDSDRKRQMEFFRAQMMLARRLGLPVVIHDRDAHGDCLDVIRDFPDVMGIFHSFSGSCEMASELVRRGWYISFSGTVTYKNARKVVESAECVPLDRLLIETDSPYLPPVPHRGELNHPKYVALTCERLAQIKGVTFEEMMSQTYENARRVYGI